MWRPIDLLFGVTAEGGARQSAILSDGCARGMSSRKTDWTHESATGATAKRAAWE